MATIYELLKKDHDKHRDLLAKLAETAGDSDERRKLWESFYCDVGAHAAAEEETFYAPLMEDEDGQPKGRHSVAEHKELDDIVQELVEMEMSSPGWLTRFKTLRERYEHHIEEEEEEGIRDEADAHDACAELGRAQEEVVHEPVHVVPGTYRGDVHAAIGEEAQHRCQQAQHHAERQAIPAHGTTC